VGEVASPGRMGLCQAPQGPRADEIGRIVSWPRPAIVAREVSVQVESTRLDAGLTGLMFGLRSGGCADGEWPAATHSMRAT